MFFIGFISFQIIYQKTRPNENNLALLWLYMFLDFFPDEVACVDKDICYEICQSYAGCTNIAYPRLVLGIMPEGSTWIVWLVISLLHIRLSNENSFFFL